MLHMVPYRMPLREAIRLGSRLLPEREGCLLRMAIAQHAFVADLAPLPGFHLESLADALRAIQSLAFPWHRLPTMLDDAKNWDMTAPLFGLIAAPSLPPSALFALESLLLQARAWHQGAWPATVALRTAGLVSLHEDEGRLWHRLEGMQAAGVRVLKAKLGRQTPAADVASLQRIQARYAGVFRWRLDAASTLDPGQAAYWEALCQDLAVDFIEDPFPRTVMPASFAVPVAYDLMQSWDELSQLGQAVQVIVVKPQKVGGISGIYANLAAQQAIGRRVILSHCYESDLSLPAYACVVQSLGLHEEVMGFGTLAYLADYLGRQPLCWRDGAWWVSPAMWEGEGSR